MAVLTSEELELKVNAAQTLSELQKVSKAYKEAFGAVTLGSPEQQKIGAGFAKLKDDIAKHTALTMSSNAKMKQSYFELGTQLRSSSVAAMNFGRVLQDLPFGLMAIANNIDPLVLSLQSLKREAKESGITMRTALLSMFRGPAGMLITVGLAATGMTLLSQAFRKTKDEAKSLADELGRTNYELGKINYQTREAQLRANVDKAKEAVEKDRKTLGRWQWMAVRVPLPWVPDSEDLARSQIDLNAAEQAYRDFTQSPMPSGGWIKEDQARAVTGQTMYPGLPTALTGAGFGRGGVGGTWGLNQNQYANAISGGAVGVQAPAQGFAQLSQEALKINAIWQSGLQGLNVGIMSVANTIRSQVGTAWERVFGEANSLLEIFAQNVVSTFAGNLANAALKGIIGSIPVVGPMVAAFLPKRSMAGGGYDTVSNYSKNVTSAYKRGFYGY